MPEKKRLVEISNATYSYPQTSVEALKNISLSISEGEYIAVLGCNGSGKSTLARMLSGFFSPDSGSVQINGDIIPGIVFQQPKEQIVAGVVERDTAFGPQNLDMDKSEIELRTMECLSVVSLADKALSRTFELSLGQTQRLAFSGILALFPDLLILDEVTAMLDPASRTEILQLIDKWNRSGHAIVHITHDRDEAMRAGRIIVMENASLVFDGPRTDFFSRTDLQLKLFGDDSALFSSDDGIKTEGEISLRAKNLTFSYPGQKVFENISLELRSGTLTALTGPSGCGKSTLFECLSGLKECEGEILASERPVLSLQESEAALFETYAADDVAFGPKKRGVKGEALVERVKNSMELCGLPYGTFADRGTFNLSGGEKRKLSLAGTVALDSQIVIFDEPTSALDPISRIKVLQMMRSLARSGKTVLFSTHRMEEADYADVQISWKKLNGSSKSEAESKQEDKTSPESGLKKMGVMQNSSILKSLQKTSAALMAPPKAPRSLIGSMPAVIKTLLFMVLFFATVAAGNAYFLLSMLALSIAYALLSKYPLRKTLTAFVKLLPWLLFFAAVQFFLYSSSADSSTVIFEKGFLRLTRGKIENTLKIFVRAPAILTILGTYIYTTSEREIMDGISGLLKPLAMIKIPVRYFVLVIGIMFRFIPLLLDELSGIIKTQLIRGAFDGKKGFAKLKILIPLFVPLILQTFRKSQYLADALTARYFR